MGILKDISNRFMAMRQRSKDKKEFFRSLLAAADDGKLTDEEITQIQTRQSELGLTVKDLKSVRVQAYIAALNAVRSDGKVTIEEESELIKLQKVLNISDIEISKSKQELARLRLITEIQNGNLPSVPVEGVVLQKAELVHWVEPGSILEERVVGRRYEGGSQGISFRIAKGVSYRVGAQRGHLVTDKAVVPVSSGELIVTSARVIFRGDSKSFSVRFGKLLEVSFYGNGVRLTDDKGKPRTVQFINNGNADIVGAILSRAINGVGG